MKEKKQSKQKHAKASRNPQSVRKALRHVSLGSLLLGDQKHFLWLSTLLAQASAATTATAAASPIAAAATVAAMRKLAPTL